MTESSTVAIVLLGGFQGGGTERAVAALARSMSRTSSHRVVLITNRAAEADRYPVDLAVRRVTLDVDIDETAFVERGVVRAIPAVILLVWRVRRALRQVGAVAVVSMLTTSNLATIVASCGRRSLRVIVSERNDTTLEPLPRPLQIARQLLYRRADVVTANVQRSLVDMARYVPEGRLRFVPNSVEVPVDQADVVSSRAVLFVGRLVSQKDPVVAVHGFAAALKSAGGGLTGRDDHRDWRMVMVGDGPLRADVDRAATEAGVDANVDRVGFVADPTPQFRDAAIFVMTSRFEGTPNALLEAMAHGLACVVADSLDGALAYVDDEVTGLIYRHDDGEHLGEQLRRLMDDAELRIRLGSAARQQMTALHPDLVAQQWLQIIAPGAQA